MIDRLEARHAALLEALAGHEVRFVVVGGVALQLHGYSGVTVDVDVTIATDAANGRQIEAALASINAQPYLAGPRGSSYRTQFGRLEVMRSASAVGDYDAWMRGASQFELPSGLQIWIGGPSDLLLSKETADRDKDRDTLPRIRADLLAAGRLQPDDIRGPVAESAPEPEPDPRLEGLLGTRPTNRRTRQLWDHAAELVADYRDRWNLAASDDLLGPPPPTETPQAEDRASLDRQLDRLTRMLGRDRPSPAELNRDELNSEDLERGR